eukprot:19992_1
MGNCQTISMDNNPNLNETQPKLYMYAIGNNKGFQLGLNMGLNNKHNVSILTNWGRTRHNRNIKINGVDIGIFLTIFSDNNNDFWGCGYLWTGKPTKIKCVDPDGCDFNPRTVYVPMQHNKGADYVFWITHKNEVYRTIIPRERPRNISNTPSTKINELKNVIDIKATNKNMWALCSSLNTNDISIVIKKWFIRHIPNDVMVIIQRYCYEQIVYIERNHYHCGRTRLEWNVFNELMDKQIIRLSTGDWHILFLNRSGSVWCYGGSDRAPALGLGDATSWVNKPTLIPFGVNHKIRITQIYSGQQHNLSVDSNNNIWSWGQNVYGQCGNGTKLDINKPELIPYLAEYNIVDIKCGDYHSYAKSKDEYHFLFGNNKNNICTLSVSLQDDACISLPFYINNIFAELTDGKEIGNVYLGCDNTFIITLGIESSVED